MGLIQRSFQGGVLILVILVIRTVWLDKLPKRIFPILWGVLLRLVLPFSFPSVFSLYTFLQKAQDRALQDRGIVGIGEGMAAASSPPPWTAVQELALGQGATGLGEESGPGALAVIWCVGAILLGTFFAAAYLGSLWKFRKAKPVDDGQVQRLLDRCQAASLCRARRISVRQSDRITAPLTYGCLRPVILLPPRDSWGSGRELEYIMQHESVHIRRHDAEMKLAMAAALCIHWFNPLVWFMCGLVNRDIELACDEGVLGRFGEKSKAGYAMALIGMEEKKRISVPLYNGFRKNDIEERINLIMKYRKAKYAAIMGSGLLVILTVLVFATSARTEEAVDAAEGSGSGAAHGWDASRDSLATDPTGKEPEAAGTDAMEGTGEGAVSGSAQSESGYMLRYLQEGMTQKEPACLYKGQGYCLLVPAEGWKASGQDAWLWETDEAVRFWVVDHSGSTWQQATARLEEDGYYQTGESGVLGKEADGIFYYARLCRNGFAVKSIHYTYPADAEHREGMGALLSAMAMNFSMMPQEGEALSEDGMLAEELAMAFWEVYLLGDREAIGEYLAEGYSDEMDVFPDGVDGHVAREAKVEAVKGLDMGTKALGETCAIWVEFRPAAEADYLEYLTLEIVKEQDGWKVGFYGLEQ